MAFKMKYINSTFMQHPFSQNAYQFDKQEENHLSMKYNNHTVVNNSISFLNKTLNSTLLYKKMWLWFNLKCEEGTTRTATMNSRFNFKILFLKCCPIL